MTPFARAERAIAARSSDAFDWANYFPRWRARAAVLIAFSTAFRVLIAATTHTANGEAYYQAWARFPSASYYDHPPLVAWMVWLTTRVSSSDFFVRVGPIACAAIFSALVFRLGERMFSARAGFIALVAVTILPAFFVTSYALNPESPLAPLWMLALLQLETMRRRDEWFRPVLLGLTIGVAFLAKYSAVLLVFVTLAYAIASPTMRRWLKRPSFYLGGLAAAIAVTPVIAWNVERGWPTLRLHFVERVSSIGPATIANHAWHAAIGQLGPFHPLVLPALLFSLGVAIWRSKSDDRFRLLALASWPVLAFLFSAMVRVRDPESHWTMVGYIPLTIALGALLDEAFSRGEPSRALRAYVFACLASSIVAFGAVYALSQSPRLRRAIPARFYDANKDPFNEMTGFAELHAALAADAAALGDDTVVASCQYALCAHILTSSDDAPRVYCPSATRTEFDFVDRRTPPTNAPVLYVTDDHYHDDARELMPERDCRPLAPVRVERDGVLMRTYQISACAPSEQASR